MAVSSRARIEANDRYNKKAYDNVQFRVRKDSMLNGDAIKAYAVSRGESLSAFLLRAVTETIERDKLKPE